MFDRGEASSGIQEKQLLPARAPALHQIPIHRNQLTVMFAGQHGFSDGWQRFGFQPGRHCRFDLRVLQHWLVVVLGEKSQHLDGTAQKPSSESAPSIRIPPESSAT